MNKLFKTLILLVLVFILVLSFVACKEKVQNVNNNTSTTVQSENVYSDPIIDTEIDMSEDESSSNPTNPVTSSTTSGTTTTSATSGSSSSKPNSSNNTTTSQTTTTSKPVNSGWTGDYDIKPSL